MPVVNISAHQHAKMLNGGMNSLMDKKRQNSPHLYSDEFTASLSALTRKFRIRRSRFNIRLKGNLFVHKQESWGPKYSGAEHLIPTKPLNKRSAISSLKVHTTR